jgi:hypothetical protein
VTATPTGRLNVRAWWSDRGRIIDWIDRDMRK